MSNIESYNYKERKVLIDYLNTFYYPNYKVECKEGKISKEYSIGTLVRLEKEGIWYDIPFIDKFNVSNTGNSEIELFNFYKYFLDKIYKLQHFYIIREDFDFKSIFQITEKERLLKTML